MERVGEDIGKESFDGDLLLLKDLNKGTFFRVLLTARNHLMGTFCC